MPPLSILDLAFVPDGGTPADALRNTLDLAQHAERGFWGRKLEIRKAKVEDGNGTLNAQGFQGRAEESRQSQILNMAAMISATTLNDIGIW